MAAFVKGVEGGSATLPCRFTFPESEKPSKISVAWRIGTFHGEPIFNNTDNPTLIHKIFTNRLTLVGNLNEREASLQISDMKRSDQDEYFCQIMLHMKSRKFAFQILRGTHLMIRGYDWWNMQSTTPPNFPTYSREPSQPTTLPGYTEDSGQPSQPPGLAACVHTVALASLATIASLLICATCMIVVVFMRGRDTRDAQ
ncbi:unnamed protein product [Lampetra planeri]